MLANDADDHMEVDVGPGSLLPAEGTSVDKKCTIRVSAEALDGERSTTTLQMALQKWCNKQTTQLTLENALSLSDGSMVFEISPAPDMKMLQDLKGRTLAARNGKTVKITSIGEFQSTLAVPVRAPMDEPGELQESENTQPVEQSDTVRSLEALAESGTCLLSVSHFWYLNHICKKEIEEILMTNGVTMESELKLAFKLQRKDGNEANAMDEFTKLTRKTLSGSETTTIPLKHLDAQKLVESLNIVKAQDEKLLLVLSSQEMTVQGPISGCNTIRKSLAASQVTNYKFCEGATWAPQQKSSDLVLNIKDPLGKEGLTMEKSDWDQMTASLRDAISAIEAKFGVKFKVLNPDTGQLRVKAHYKTLEQNTSMESHATRALVRLYQKFVTSQRLQEARSAAPRSDYQSVAEPVLGPFGGAVSNGQWGPSRAAAALGLDEGGVGGESEVEKCPICLDSFTDKMQLKCKHKFCRSCLKEAVRNQGKICPVCKDVFGTVEGDQPDGKMSFHISRTSLPGFESYGTIEITYQIPSGCQTEKHPNPGQCFEGTRRKAYLPDNAEGKEVLKLLRKAFDRKLIFTVGTSRTSGAENQVTWNDIHHKTCCTGGPLNFGYPDPTYLARVKDELKSKGIV